MPSLDIDRILQMHDTLRATAIGKLTPDYLPLMGELSQTYLLAHPTYVMKAQELWSGERYRMQPEEMRVPSDYLINGILFAGQGSFARLKDATYAQVASWSDRIPSWDSDQKGQEKPLRFRTNNIFNALRFVEQHMGDERRGTGEPAIAHQYRTVLQAMDLLGYSESLRLRTGTIFSFSPETAELFLLMNVLHDFVEKDKKPKFDSSGNNVETRIVPYSPYPEDTSRQNGLYLQRFSVPVGVDDKDKYAERYLVAELHLDVQRRYFQNFIRGIEALDTAGLDGKEGLERVTGLMSSSRRDETEFVNIIMLMMPRIVKCLDRLDNVRTRTFELNPHYDPEDESNRLFMPRDAEGIIRKARETLEAFPPIEHGLLYLGYNRSMTIPTVLYTAGTGNYTHAGTLDSYLAGLRPTRWAVYTLAGLSPDEIWEYYPSQLGPSLPRLR